MASGPDFVIKSASLYVLTGYLIGKMALLRTFSCSTFLLVKDWNVTGSTYFSFDAGIGSAMHSCQIEAVHTRYFQRKDRKYAQGQCSSINNYLSCLYHSSRGMCMAPILLSTRDTGVQFLYICIVRIILAPIL